MNGLRSLSATLDLIDRTVARWMHRIGHPLHRISLAVVFIWFGMIKVFGYKSATSLIADTVYIGSPERTVPILGVWEALIGVCLLSRPLIRVALFLLGVRLIGTSLALIFQADVCFGGHPLVPTPQGQYLIKDLMLFSAAMVIGGSVRTEQRRGHSSSTQA